MMFTLKVSGITCSGCVNAIRKAVGEAASGAKVEVDIASGKVSIGDEADPAVAIRAIEDAGYEVIGPWDQRAN